MASLNQGWVQPSVLVSGQPQAGEVRDWSTSRCSFLVHGERRCLQAFTSPQVSKGEYQYYQYYVSGDNKSPVIRITLIDDDDSDQVRSGSGTAR
jgi:hypothetical protein